MNPESAGISTTVALTGLLPFVVLAAAAVSYPLSLLLLSIYRRAVIRGMSALSEMPGSDTACPAPGQPPAEALRLERLGAIHQAGAGAATGALREALAGPWQAAGVYAVAGATYAVVMTAGWLMATRDPALPWVKLATLFWTYCWPAVLAALLVAAYDRRRRLQVLGAYFVPLAALMALAVARNPDLGAGALPLYWLITNAPASILLATFLLRPIRAVGPLVLVFLLMVSVGSQGILSAAASREPVLRAIADAGFALGLGAGGVFFGLILIGGAVFAALGWPLLAWIGRRYERKKFSDRSLTLDSVWLLFGIVQSIGLAFEGAAWILTGLAGFVAYKLAAGAAFGVVLRGRDAAPRTLLLLRVFRLGRRSEQLFDKLRRHWLQAGSIAMIAGPDLATSTVEPHEFLGFLSGRLARQFVTSPADLDRRMLAADAAPDPDGRYRVNEFFCRNDTWQMTMQRLAAASDTVLMDLRSFSAANQGCLFELHRLLDGVDLNRVVFLIDQTTDAAFLEATLQRLWQTLDAASPNRRTGPQTARLFAVKDQSGREVTALLRHLLDPVPVTQA